MRKIFVTGIGTDVGKTLVSAILVEALEADYWKPVQTGELKDSDSNRIKDLISNSYSKIHKEAYWFKQALSPHTAAALSDSKIEPESIKLPEASNRKMIIEGAGGLMVPLNNEILMLDLIRQLEVEVVLVSKNYLGSINHTLLTLTVLKQHHIKVLGIIFNGEKNSSSEDLILNYTGVKYLGRIKNLEVVNKEMVKNLSKNFKDI